MPYTAISTLSAGDILTASHMNTLSGNVAFLNGLVSSVNVPFNSLRTTVSLRSNNNQWLLKYQHQYLHHKSRGISGNNDDFHILITIGSQDYCVHYDNTDNSAGGSTGYVDLEDMTSWTSYEGTWATTTQYREFQIVLNSGTYYQANTTHTSAASFATDAAKWDSLGTDTSPFVAGTRYPVWVYTTADGAYEFVVDYLLASNSTSI